MATYLITGTSRGLGLELTKQILEGNPENKVVAGARKPHESEGLQQLLRVHPNRLTLVVIDVESDESVKAAAKAVTESHPEGIDYLLNNAGIVGPKECTPEALAQVYNANVIGVLRVIQAFLPLVRKGKKKVVVSTSSRAGSISSQKGIRDFFKTIDGEAKLYVAGYRMSKCALNMLTAMLAQDYADEGITFVSVHPGAVKTDMLVGVGGAGDKAPSFAISAEVSVKGQLEVIHKVKLEDSGKFFLHNGEIIPW